MGLLNLLTTSASGMSAQSALLNTVSDNIANVSTIGYKQTTAEFSSLVAGTGVVSDYNSGSVLVTPQVEIDQQGNIQSTTSTSDLAIKGNGYFIVQEPNGQKVLTRSGAFTESNTGELVNAAGFTLLGYASGKGGVANGYANLVPVNVAGIPLSAKATSTANLYVNLPSNSTAVASAYLPDTAYPATGTAAAQYTEKASITTYDKLGTEVNLDVYMTKTADNTWEVDVFNSANATSGGFPYSSAPLATGTLTFSPTTGALLTDTLPSFTTPGASGTTISLDMSKTTQYAGSYTLTSVGADGNATSAVTGYTIGTDGTVSVTYQNNSTAVLYTIPLATVASPDSMTVISGNAYIPNQQSGVVQIGAAQTGTFGSIKSSSLESSTVDLATQLTTMIAAQNNYEANSKVFNTGSELLQVLVNLGK